MAKALKIAAIVVGVAAIVVTGGATLGLLPAVIPVLGISATALGSILSLAGGLLGAVAGMMAKKPKIGSAGTALDFVADPASGEPYFMGEGATGMDIVHQASWGDKNKNLGMIGAMSLGPIAAYLGLIVDGNTISFAGGNATGYYHNFMYLATQLGAQPEASVLNPPVPGMPDWGGAHKMSGIAAAAMVLVADTKNGKVYSGGVPKMFHRIQGVLAYDPRNDSTRGGSGTQRAGTESTYAYSANPWAHHGTYALGRFQNGKRVIGPGIPADSIDWASHIEAANIADAHNWKVSGRIMSTDRKWDVLKSIAQAGGGYPVSSGSKLSCIVNAPRVSLATIETKHLKGPLGVPQMNMRRDRINAAIPRVRDSAHGWEITPGLTVLNPTYVAEDGGNTRTREVEFALVADAGDGLGKTQAAQLVAYDIANSRERVPIPLELGLEWSEYKVGDCLTLNIPEALLFNQKAIVIGRTFNAMRNTVTLQFRTETDAKHTWALSLTGTTPTPPTFVTPIGSGDAGTTLDVNTVAMIQGSSLTGLTFTVGVPAGGVSSVTVSAHNRIYPDKTVSVNALAATNVTCNSGDLVIAYYDDPDRVGGAVTYQFLVLSAAIGDTSPAFASEANPYRHTVFSKIVPAAGGSTGGGSGSGSGGGGGGGGSWGTYPPGPAEP